MSEGLKRYNCASATRPCLERSDEGRYVSYSDYADLQRENDRLRVALLEIASEACCGMPTCSEETPSCDVMVARAALKGGR